MPCLHTQNFRLQRQYFTGTTHDLGQTCLHEQLTELTQKPCDNPSKNGARNKEKKEKENKKNAENYVQDI